MTSGIYTARYRLEDGIWVVEIEEIPQVHSFGRTFAQARSHITDALALWLEVDTAGWIDLQEKIEGVPDDVSRVVSTAIDARQRAAVLASEAQKTTKEAAKALVSDAGMSVRDAATVLHISHQRVHQLLK